MISDLKKKILEQQKAIRMNEKNEAQIKRLAEDIKSMKQQRVKLIKQMREDAEKVRELLPSRKSNGSPLIDTFPPGPSLEAAEGEGGPEAQTEREEAAGEDRQDGDPPLQAAERAQEEDGGGHQHQQEAQGRTRQAKGISGQVNGICQT